MIEKKHCNGNNSSLYTINFIYFCSKFMKISLGCNCNAIFCESSYFTRQDLSVIQTFIIVKERCFIKVYEKNIIYGSLFYLTVYLCTIR